MKPYLNLQVLTFPTRGKYGNKGWSANSSINQTLNINFGKKNVQQCQVKGWQRGEFLQMDSLARDSRLLPIALHRLIILNFCEYFCCFTNLLI